MKRTVVIAPFMIVGLLAMRPALAVTWIYIPDMSQLKYQLYPDGHIYLRNLSDFSASALGCCYNYSLDTTTQDGRNTWATMLSAIAQHTGLYLGIPDGLVAGNVSYVGVW